jgi:hypothetical protein
MTKEEVVLTRNSRPEGEIEATEIGDSPLRQVKFRWTGLRPLIMSNVRGVDPDEPLVIELKKLTSKRGQDLNKDLRGEIQRIEWELSAYHDAQIGFYIPSENIEKALREGAAKSRKGKKIEAGAFVSGSMVPFKNQPFKDLDKAYARPEYRLRCAVRVPPRTGARVMKTRCRIPSGWVLEFAVECHRSIDETTLEEAAKEAGLFVGLANWRPKHGRFESEII